ncbi:hypothetical protein CERSUDRAFT_69197 [Gelatoporia subvermispora B]|uniref:Xylanolytic transcriptional activator regulatory domain-containing protein n=1 Tax=Ceriporiopsis subvermispora (strain B) TaxID=914234 RepID=M2P8I9_CERS8|nr:hypothetical protein CERSUDRAFT_69197 [Gelatoporia subvermispora B]
MFSRSSPCCKRLKLNCDRRTPCGSCLKRDSTARCIYSAAAAEKVDVQSLRNRLMNVEGTLEQLTTGSPAQFKAPFGVQPESAGAGAPAFAIHFAGTSAPPLDRALLATGAAGSSVVISLEDVASIWLGELEELGIDPRMRVVDPITSTNPAASGGRQHTAGSGRVKKEPSPGALPPASPAGATSAPYTAAQFVPPVPIEAFYAREGSPPQVTPALLARLPSPSARPRLLSALADTMLLHPCFNVRHFVQRVEAMFAWGESAGDAPIPASQAELQARGKPYMAELARDIFGSGAATKKGAQRAQAQAQIPGGPHPTLSFFAVASAAFALGALGAEGAEADPAALHALSEQALGVFEKTAPYDLDAVVAMLLQVLYLLHDGRTCVAQGVFPLVGKMINVARMMGLAHDPDDCAAGVYSVFDAETRRRVWWDVFYYDLFVSDCMGHPPLIADNSFTTRLPAEVDEEQFSPSSMTLPASTGGEGSEKGTAYFVLKCRLAQLVKNVKKQTFRDPLSDDPGELSIDQAAGFESNVTSFLSELPEAFRLDMSQDPSHLTTGSSPGSPFLLAQQCELVILANRVILKLYLPFLKEASLNTGRPGHQAFFGTISAAHAIIFASRVLHRVWQDTRPAAFDFYDFGRTLFEAAVVCAHALVQQPTNMLTGEAMKSVASAVEILRRLGAARGGVEGAHAERSRAEAIRIVEIMMHKAEAARTRNASAAAAGAKRKHGELEPEGEHLPGDFRFPFVGAAVASKTDHPRPAPHPKPTAPAPTRDASAPEPKSRAEKKLKEKDDKRDKERSKEKDREKTKYPTVGIRVRPNHVPPAVRQRGHSSATPVSATSVNAPPLPPPSQPQPPPAAPVSHVPPPITAFTELLTPPPQSHNGSPQFETMRTNDYPVQYSTPEDDRQRYTHQTYAEPTQAPVYTQPQPPQHQTHYAPPAQSPTTYASGPSPSNYYMYELPAPSSGYDSSGTMSHAQNISMVDTVTPSPITTGSARGSMGPPMSTPSHEPQFSFNAQGGKQDHGIPAQMGHEYQQAPQTMPMQNPHILQWQHAQAPMGWAPEYNKYYTG